jgi:hypothetical protein
MCRFVPRPILEGCPQAGSVCYGSKPQSARSECDRHSGRSGRVVWQVVLHRVQRGELDAVLV